MQLAASPSPPNPESPNTPVNIVEHADPKIQNPDIDAVLAQPEPLHVKEVPPAPAEEARTYDTPPVEGQTGLVLSEDVNMEEGAAESGPVGEVGQEEEVMAEAETGEGELDGDVTMDTAVHEGEGHSPPAGSSTTAVDSVVEDEQPPVKRARKHSDADLASAHTTPTAAPAQTSTAPLSAAQYKFLSSTLRQLKKLKDAGPFRQPVDPVALGIPHYFQVVKHPMDIQTVERKLGSSNPAKPDQNATNPRYTTADELVHDVRQIFINSVTFNGPEHPVTQMGKRVEEQFDKALKQLPPPDESRAEPSEPSWLSRPTHTPSTSARPAKPVTVKKEKVASPSPPAPPTKKAAAVQRRPSTSTPTIRRNDDSHRPKREIHAPATKELPYTNEPKKPRRRASKSGASNEQLKYCGKILEHLNKKQYFNTVAPFSEPVDWVKLQIPDYPKIVKKPMDLGTMRAKLDNGEYMSADRFRADFNQIIKNCCDYNPKNTAVYQAGQTLKGLFEEKWRGLPPLHPTVESEDDEDDDFDDDEESERTRKLQEMQQQMSLLQAQMAQIQGSPPVVAKKPKIAPPPPPPPPKKRKAPPPEPSVSAPLPSSSKPKKERAPPPPPPPPKKKAINRKTAVIPDDDVLSFDQKKELSEAIGTLDGTKLERVINIIHEGVPEIRDSQEEIELEIDALPANVLTKLYNFVIRPMKPPPPKKPRTGKGTGTGGLKRKSMDEDVEEAKIRRLEAQMRLFDEHAATGSTSGSAPLPPIPEPAANGHESDSSSDDDSSGSDSE